MALYPRFCHLGPYLLPVSYLGLPLISFQATPLGKKASPALPQKVGPVATQVKTDRGKDHSGSSEELTDSEEEAAPAASAAQVGTREERQSGCPGPPQSETPPLRIRWVLVSRETRGSCISERMSPGVFPQPSSALSPQAKPALEKQMKASSRKGTPVSATGASTSSHCKAGAVTSSASLSSLALAKGTQRPDVYSSNESESEGAAPSTPGVQVRAAFAQVGSLPAPMGVSGP